MYINKTTTTAEYQRYCWDNIRAWEHSRCSIFSMVAECWISLSSINKTLVKFNSFGCWRARVIHCFCVLMRCTTTNIYGTERKRMRKMKRKISTKKKRKRERMYFCSKMIGNYCWRMMLEWMIYLWKNKIQQSFILNLENWSPKFRVLWQWAKTIYTNWIADFHFIWIQIDC